MPFSNPIVAGTSLVRTAIKSPNYVAGTTGWTVNRDGTAEFSSATIRGSVVVGGATPPNLVLGPLTAAVIAYYALFGETAVTGLTYYGTAANYKYDALLLSGGVTIRAAGSFTGGNVQELRRDVTSGISEQMIIGQRYASAGLQLVNGGILTVANSSTISLLNTAQIMFGDTSGLQFNGAGQINLNLAAFGGDSLIDNVSQPRGLLWFVSSTTPTGALAAETVVLTAPSRTYKDTRAYHVEWTWVSAQTVVGNENVKIRRGTTTAGANKASWAAPHFATNTITQQGWCVIVNASGADITDQAVITTAPGAGTVAVGATATTVQVAKCWDCGAAADYPLCIQF